VKHYGFAATIEAPQPIPHPAVIPSLLNLFLVTTGQNNIGVLSLSLVWPLFIALHAFIGLLAYAEYAYLAKGGGNGSAGEGEGAGSAGAKNLNGGVFPRFLSLVAGALPAKVRANASLSVPVGLLSAIPLLCLFCEKVRLLTREYLSPLNSALYLLKKKKWSFFVLCLHLLPRLSSPNPLSCPL
jgi:hypothetical protein